MDYGEIARHAAASQKWNPESVNALLMVNDRAVARALVKLHDRQTAAEQASRATSVHNLRGFNGLDAEFMSSLAERVKKGWGLTPKQLACIRKTDKKGKCRLGKYARQLLEAE